MVFARLGTLTGINAQPGWAVAKDLVKPSISRLPQGMKPEAGQPARLTVAG
jgi:hypothetical protein